MKILHTSDWHLGKRLYGVSRLNEQADVLAEITEIAERECVDVVLVCGDIFDTSVPPAAAESLFYESAIRLSKNRLFVAFSGNHDDPLRLAAPAPIAAALNIVLIGEGLSKPDIERFNAPSPFLLPYSTGKEQLNLLLLPYLSPARLDALVLDGDTYAAKTQLLLEKHAAHFSEKSINLTAAHLFFAGGFKSDEERMLGGAQLLPLSVLPPAAYTALGHIHKPMCLSKSHNIYYSGSPLSYTFGESGAKCVNLIESDGKTTTVKQIELTHGKPLVQIAATDAASALAALDAAGDAYAEVTLNLTSPLSPAETRALRRHPACLHIRVENKAETTETTVRRRDLSDAALFSLFYQTRTATPPDAQTEALFLSLLEGERA